METANIVEELRRKVFAELGMPFGDIHGGRGGSVLVGHVVDGDLFDLEKALEGFFRLVGFVEAGEVDKDGGVGGEFLLRVFPGKADGFKKGDCLFDFGRFIFLEAAGLATEDVLGVEGAEDHHCFDTFGLRDYLLKTEFGTFIVSLEDLDLYEAKPGGQVTFVAAASSLVGLLIIFVDFGKVWTVLVMLFPGKEVPSIARQRIDVCELDGFARQTVDGRPCFSHHEIIAKGCAR